MRVMFSCIILLAGCFSQVFSQENTNSGFLSGVLKVMSADGNIRMYQIVLSRNLLTAGDYWYRGQNSELSAAMGAKYIIELKKTGNKLAYPQSRNRYRYYY